MAKRFSVQDMDPDVERSVFTAGLMRLHLGVHCVVRVLGWKSWAAVEVLDGSVCNQQNKEGGRKARL